MGILTKLCKFMGIDELRDEIIDPPAPASSVDRSVVPYMNPGNTPRWHNVNNYSKFAESSKAMLRGVQLGFEHQADLHKERLYDVILGDRADKTIAGAHHMGFKSVQMFAAIEPGREKAPVLYDGIHWQIKTMDEFNECVPLEYLERIAELKQAGLDFDGHGVAVPAPPPKPVRVRPSDPILLGRIGKYWILIGRWD